MTALIRTCLPRPMCVKLAGPLVLLSALFARPGFAADDDRFTPLNAPSSPQTIIGGIPTQAGELDAVVALRIESHLCSGSVVAPSLVLTAAHCLAEVDRGTPISIEFGQNTDTSTSMQSNRFGVHPQFCDVCSHERHDFAYVQLPEPYYPIDGFLEPIVEQSEWDEAMQLGNVVLVAGFGTDDPSADGFITDEIKRKVTTTITNFTSQGYEFRAGGGQRDTCSGDSGGPAIALLGNGAMRLAGVTSRGSKPCGRGGWYGVPYTALLWLRSQTGVDLMSPNCPTGGCLDIEPADANNPLQCAVAPGRRGGPWSAWLVLLSLLWIRPRRRTMGERCR